MGYHYVPQAHLRRFQIDDEPNFIWMYDKKTEKFSKAKISKVAQQKKYYSQEVERGLHKGFEIPGNNCIQKILKQEKLDNGDRSQLSDYMLTMATRGPRQRRKSLDRVPKALDRSVDKVRKHITEQSQREDVDEKALLSELEARQKEFSQEPPQQVVDQIREPFWSERTVECIQNMTWHILPVPPSMHFVTCDTPAHFFDGLGLGNQNSEFTFAISKSFALIGEHNHSRGVIYEKPQARLVRTVNSRILSHTERFVFSPRKDDWIENVAQKKNPSLSLIRWK